MDVYKNSVSERMIPSVDETGTPASPAASAPRLSLVIPIYNEEENIEPLYAELTGALEALGDPYEVIAIDDGSHDRSFINLKAIHQRDPRWRVLRFRRNFGQTTAIAAGFDAARASVIITMDADLQNDPADIARLLEKIDEGYDIVSGWRKDRKEPFLSRRLPSTLANLLISRTTHISLHDYGCTLKAYRSDVAKNVRLYGELHRFIPAVASWMGVVVCEVPVNDRKRRFGTSKYGISRTLRVLLDLVAVLFFLKFATRPLHFFGNAGLILGGIGGIIGVYLAYLRIVLIQPIGDRPLLLLAVLLVLLGVQMIGIGLVAELVTRVYHEPAGKPIYMIREQLDGAVPDEDGQFTSEQT